MSDTNRIRALDFSGGVLQGEDEVEIRKSLIMSDWGDLLREARALLLVSAWEAQLNGRFR